MYLHLEKMMPNEQYKKSSVHKSLFPPLTSPALEFYLKEECSSRNSKELCVK